MLPQPLNSKKLVGDAILWRPSGQACREAHLVGGADLGWPASSPPCGQALPMRARGSLWRARYHCAAG